MLSVESISRRFTILMRTLLIVSLEGLMRSAAKTVANFPAQAAPLAGRALRGEALAFHLPGHALKALSLAGKVIAQK